MVPRWLSRSASASRSCSQVSRDFSGTLWTPSLPQRHLPVIISAEIQAPVVNSDHMMQQQRVRRCKLFGKGDQSRQACCLSFAVPRVRCALPESRSLDMERNVGGEFHPKHNMHFGRPIRNNNHGGKMQRSSERHPKMPEIVGIAVSWGSFVW